MPCVMTLCQAVGSATEAGKSPGARLREMTFLSFASVEYDGNVYMTPNDFLQSIVDDKPRCKPLSPHSFVFINKNTHHVFMQYIVNMHQQSWWWWSLSAGICTML